MAKEDRASKAAIVVSTGAAIAAGLAWLRSSSAQAAPGDTQIPEELMQLIIAIASDVENIDKRTLQDILAALTGGDLNIQVQGWPPNTQGTRTVGVVCDIVGRAYPFSDMEIPDGMALAIKAAPGNAIASLIYVATTPAECLNPNSAWPLIPNESIAYNVKNANAFCVSSNIAGSISLYSAEQRS